MTSETRPSPIVTVADRLLSWSPWRVLAAAAAVRVVWCGIYTTPNVPQWVALAGDPFGPAPVHPAAHFITGSPLGPILAWLVGATTTTTYGVVHLVLLVVSACLLVGIAKRTCGDAVAIGLVVLLLASPLSNVLLTWLGQPDAITFGALSVIGLASSMRRQAWSAAAAVASATILGFNGFEQGLAAVAVVGVVQWSSGRERDRHVVVAALVGLAIGRLLLWAFLAVSDAPFLSRSAWAETVGTEPFVRGFLQNLPVLLWSAFGAGWFVVRAAVDDLRGVPRGAFVVAAVIALGTAAVALDETRVLGLVTWPALVWSFRTWADSAPPATVHRLLGLTAILGAIVPPVVVWEGSIYVSAWGRITAGW